MMLESKTWLLVLTALLISKFGKLKGAIGQTQSKAGNKHFGMDIGIPNGNELNLS